MKTSKLQTRLSEIQSLVEGIREVDSELRRTTIAQLQQALEAKASGMKKRKYAAESDCEDDENAEEDSEAVESIDPQRAARLAHLGRITEALVVTAKKAQSAK